MARVNYYEYIQSDIWREKRNAYGSIIGWKCEKCGRTPARKFLHLHHKTYERLGHEKAEDVIMVCCFCHSDTHTELKNEQPPKPIR
jgi:hypothetical protein